MFEKFADYMYSLLFTPLMKVKKALNQFYIYFKVIGKLFDDLKQDILLTRAQAAILSCEDAMLDEHGRDYRMPRLQGETYDAYRLRLCMKAIIAEKGGTIPGILLALASLGYNKSQIEPMKPHDPERWAEFIVWLAGDNPTITDLRIIHKEVMDVKEAGSMPVYGCHSPANLKVYSEHHAAGVHIPICNTLLSGLWPEVEATGRSEKSRVAIYGENSTAGGTPL